MSVTVGRNTKDGKQRNLLENNCVKLTCNCSFYVASANCLRVVGWFESRFSDQNIGSYRNREASFGYGCSPNLYLFVFTMNIMEKNINDGNT